MKRLVAISLSLAFALVAFAQSGGDSLLVRKWYSDPLVTGQRLISALSAEDEIFAPLEVLFADSMGESGISRNISSLVSSLELKGDSTFAAGYIVCSKRPVAECRSTAVLGNWTINEDTITLHTNSLSDAVFRQYYWPEIRETPITKTVRFTVSATNNRLYINRLKPKIKGEPEERYEGKTILSHATDINDIRIAVAGLMKHEPYASDAKLDAFLQQSLRGLTRQNVYLYIDYLRYILALEINPHQFENESERRMATNLKHLIIHTLADYYMSRDNYTAAIDYYTQAVFDYPYATDDSRLRMKDRERCIVSIIKAYRRNGQTDQAYAYMLGMLISSPYLSETMKSELFALIGENEEDIPRFLSDTEAAMHSIYPWRGDSFMLIFRGQLAFFFPPHRMPVSTYVDDMLMSEFYLTLEEIEAEKKLSAQGK
ncbi:hypothetical protein [Dysgonomonas sp. 25]|uniref:hypothetical protein n=1 Tax=Dysgonomonas sp. 25 TaxID=2302933 RepID=UPI0013D89996|nr:hypothetical protein [Dysgonomonas sp. 25]NDV69301.1 hypothetical protein [Dysgonomonas sp. 25]